MALLYGSTDHDRPRLAENVHDVQEALRQKSIEYRVIGSIAATGYGLERPDSNLNTDIDVIVPRVSLHDAREVREKFEKAKNPIKLGLAIPTMQVDFKPTERTSFLTAGRHAISIDSKHFQAYVNDFEGTEVTTVPLNTLMHVYRHLSPNIPKYNIKAAKLSALIEEPESIKAFEDYQILRARRAPFAWHAMDAAGVVIRALPQRQAEQLRSVGRRVADQLHMR